MSTTEIQAAELDALRTRLAEAEAELAALREGDADALVTLHGVIGLAGIEKPYRVFFEAMNEGGLTLDAAGRVLHCNPRLAAMLERSVEALRGGYFLDHVIAEERARVADLLARRGPAAGEATLLTRAASPLPVQLSLSPIDLDAPGLICVVVTDLSERALAEAGLRRAAIVFDNSQEGIVVCDSDNRILDVNPAFSLITGYAREEVLGLTPKILNSGLQDAAFYKRMWHTLGEKMAWRGEIWNRRKNGEIYAERLSINVIRNPITDAAEYYVGVFSDNSEAKAHAEALDRIAHYDTLTGIPNRRLLVDRMAHSIGLARRGANNMAICYLDLDGFKLVNDSYGHDTGDRLLVIITQRLSGTLRAGDTLARLSGDDFVMLFNDLDHDEECFQVLDRVLAVVSTPILIEGATHTLTASIGVTLFPLDDADADTLLRHADQAMYRAKEAGKNRFHLYDLEYDQQVKAHREALQHLADALRRDEFVLYYQPKVNLLTAEVVGAEALIRWQHPARGLLAPAEFLHFLPGTDLEIAVGEWVIETALKQVAAWNAAGLELTVSVNVSPHHLQSLDFAERLRLLLGGCPEVSSRHLELEILESAAIGDLERAMQTMNACLALGVRFALDDFGTGYSSLTYFRKLPIDTLKIDQAFVRDMLDDPEALGIVESVVRLAKVFNRPVIAEGVETLEHGAMLTFLGCQLAQGYGISRPMPAQQMIEWVATWRSGGDWQNLVNGAICQSDVTLSVAGASHRKWIEEIALYVRDPSTKAFSNSHAHHAHQCRFGHWYLGSGRVDYGQWPEYVALEPLHAQVHALALELVALTEIGRSQDAVSRLPELFVARDSLLASLKKLMARVRRAGGFGGRETDCKC